MPVNNDSKVITLGYGDIMFGVQIKQDFGQYAITNKLTIEYIRPPQEIGVDLTGKELNPEPVTVIIGDHGAWENFCRQLEEVKANDGGRVYLDDWVFDFNQKYNIKSVDVVLKAAYMLRRYTSSLYLAC